MVNDCHFYSSRYQEEPLKFENPIICEGELPSKLAEIRKQVELGMLRHLDGELGLD